MTWGSQDTTGGEGVNGQRTLFTFLRNYSKVQPQPTQLKTQNLFDATAKNLSLASSQRKVFEEVLLGIVFVFVS